MTKQLSSYPFSHFNLFPTLMELIMQENYLTKQGNISPPSQKNALCPILLALPDTAVSLALSDTAASVGYYCPLPNVAFLSHTGCYRVLQGTTGYYAIVLLVF